ncbi:hypothetical protein BDY21DRAFT_359726 [Lineolata rhizophorae]|uniref:Uncharacterized protein n=1 Tax=Lineolata rhizophorae TaxID=578093 RepID=A0A6A6NKM3_9PEZI|nr:hypothetical protein BDY21DRAFT_359726 [Lineolata rhizophorae]
MSLPVPNLASVGPVLVPTGVMLARSNSPGPNEARGDSFVPHWPASTTGDHQRPTPPGASDVCADGDQN